MVSRRAYFRRGQMQPVQIKLPINGEYKVPKQPPPSIESSSSKEEMADANELPCCQSPNSLGNMAADEEKTEEAENPEMQEEFLELELLQSNMLQSNKPQLIQLGF